MEFFSTELLFCRLCLQCMPPASLQTPIKRKLSLFRLLIVPIVVVSGRSTARFAVRNKGKTKEKEIWKQWKVDSGLPSIPGESSYNIRIHYYSNSTFGFGFKRVATSLGFQTTILKSINGVESHLNGGWIIQILYSGWMICDLTGIWFRAMVAERPKAPKIISFKGWI